jgi:Tfp pilus assembly protein PilV
MPALRAGFSLVEFLLVACLLGVGLLGLGALQLGVVRGLGGAWARLAALTLAGNALEDPAVWGPQEPESRTERFDHGGQPTQAPSGLFTLTVRRWSPAGPDGPAAVRATVTWADPVPGRVSLTRLVRP